MRTKSYRTITAIAVIMFAGISISVSCGKESLKEDSQPAITEMTDGIYATISGYTEDATKVAFQGGLANFRWSNGDCIGICRSGSTANGTAAFTILLGGEATGNFINDAFALNKVTEYFAFYPYNGNTVATSFIMDLKDQKQSGNNDLSHIGKKNYMYASFTTDENGSANFNFTNLCSIIQVHFTADSKTTYSGMTVSSDDKKFITKSSFNLTTKAYMPTETSSNVNLSFGEEGLDVSNGESVTLSLAAIPVDLSGSKLTFTVADFYGNVKQFTLGAFAMTAGKVYHYYEDDAKGDPVYGSCPNGDHHHAVDLGLPSGTLWACCDLGAEYPSQFGVEFAWGETELITKNTSTWLNYKFMDVFNTENNERAINKYQIADNRYDMPWYNSTDSTFIGDGKNKLELIDDAAHVNWGGSWVIPTKEQVEELLNYTAEVKTDDYNGTGQPGRIFFKKKVNGNYSLRDNHIFIPTTRDYVRYYTGSATYYIACYWTSNLSTTANGEMMSFDGNPINSRITRHRIRPVCSK